MVNLRMKKNTDIFLVNTPRQWWIACAVALHQKKTAHLIIEDSFNDADVFYQITKSWAASPFIDVTLLFGKNSWQFEINRFKRYWLKNSEKKKRINQYNSLVKKFDFEHIYASNVNNWNVQYLLHLANNKASRAGCSYLDDGVISYINFYDKPHKEMSFLKLMKRKLYYGWWFKRPQPVGNVSWVSKGYVFSIDRVKPNLKKINLVELSSDYFNQLALEKLGESLFNYYDFDISSWKNVKKVFIFSKVSRLGKICPGYSLYMNDVVTDLTNEKDDVWIKYHPGELELDPLQIKPVLDKVKIIPRSIPFEILIFWMNDKDQVTGDVSTVLMDVKLQHKNIQTEAFICKDAYPELVNLYKSIGIKINYFSS